jgi:hypothetical protein
VAEGCTTRGFCRLRKVIVTKAGPAVEREPPGQPDEPSLQSVRALFTPPPPPRPRPRQSSSIKSVPIAFVGTIALVAVIGAAVTIASYSDGLGEKKETEADASLISGGSDVPEASSTPDALVPLSPQAAESDLEQPAADASGMDFDAVQEEDARTDAVAESFQTTRQPPPIGSESASAPASSQEGVVKSQTANGAADGHMPQTVNESGSAPAPTGYSIAEGKTDDWFVILKTYPKKDADKAAQSSSYFRGLGFDTHAVDTDVYQNFKGGMSAVILGPYSHDTATEMVRKLRPIVPDVYAKSGKASLRRE